MRSSLRFGAAVLTLLGSAGLLQAADDRDRGIINRGAEEVTRPPTGAPAGVMQQSGAGTAVRDVPATNTPSGAFPWSSAAAPGATTDKTENMTDNTGIVTGGPIGATDHTMPAKFSARNAMLDKTPIMAHPLPLTDEQRGMVYASLAANGDVETRAIDAEPAHLLPDDVKLYDLPDKVTEQVPALKGYKYVKLVDKIVLVSPPNRIVVGEIAK